jgi:phage tail tube protein FII
MLSFLTGPWRQAENAAVTLAPAIAYYSQRLNERQSVAKLES